VASEVGKTRCGAIRDGQTAVPCGSHVFTSSRKKSPVDDRERSDGSAEDSVCLCELALRFRGIGALGRHIHRQDEVDIFVRDAVDGKEDVHVVGRRLVELGDPLRAEEHGRRGRCIATVIGDSHDGLDKRLRGVVIVRE
jgi:hypothetical protein